MGFEPSYKIEYVVFSAIGLEFLSDKYPSNVVTTYNFFSRTPVKFLNKFNVKLKQ